MNISYILYILYSVCAIICSVYSQRIRTIFCVWPVAGLVTDNIRPLFIATAQALRIVHSLDLYIYLDIHLDRYIKYLSENNALFRAVHIEVQSLSMKFTV